MLHPFHILALTGFTAVAAWHGAAIGAPVDRVVDAVYAPSSTMESRTQGVVLVAVRGDPPARLYEAIAVGAPRMVVDLEGLASGCALWVEHVGCLMGPVVVDRFAEIAEPSEPRAVRVPTVPAQRVASGEVPSGTFGGRLVVVGRAEPGPMSQAQLLARRLLTIVDEAGASVPAWGRALALALWVVALWALARQRRPVVVITTAAAACGLAFLLNTAPLAGVAALVGVVALAAAALASRRVMVWQRRVQAVAGEFVAAASGRYKASVEFAAAASGRHRTFSA